jgi:esterase/lipase
MPDGLVIAATYYGALNHPAPAVLLLHQLGSNKETWQGFANRLQAAGFNVLAIDLRGHGATGGVMDWAKAPDDVSNVFAQLRTLPGVDSARVSVIGASIGANLALGVCADSGQCKSTVLLSPGLDYIGVKTADAMSRYGVHPVLIVASRDDNPSGANSPALDKLAKGDHKLQLYNGSVHGIALLDSQGDLALIILKWLADH